MDGLLRVAVFVFYIWLIGRMEDIKRMFMYHGAEHKAIHCFEHGLPMTPENARQFPRLHVRCGTAFLIMVMVIAILVYTIFPSMPSSPVSECPTGCEARTRHCGAHRADARYRRHLLRDHGEVGREPSGQPAREGDSLARHADAVPYHPRARRCQMECAIAAMQAVLAARTPRRRRRPQSRARCFLTRAAMLPSAGAVNKL